METDIAVPYLYTQEAVSNFFLTVVQIPHTRTSERSNRCDNPRTIFFSTLCSG